MSKRVGRSLFLCLLLCFIVGTVMFSPSSVSSSSEGSGWLKELNTSWGGLGGIAYNGKDQYVLVGRDGSIKVSKNGSSWTGVDSGTTAHLMGVTWGDGLYAAVGYRGIILTSKDGINWSIAKAGLKDEMVSVDFNSIVWGNGRFVAVGRSGYVLTSQDGQTWTELELSGSGHRMFENVIWDGTEFLIMDGVNTKWTSKDGIEWSQKTLNIDRNIRFCSVARSEDQYVFIGLRGAIATSADGDNLVFQQWKEDSMLKDIDLHDIIWDGQQYIVVGRDESHQVFGSMYYKGIVLTSPDGVNWTQVFEAGWEFNRIVYNESKYMITGKFGELYISNDGKGWTSINPKHAVNLHGVAWSGSKFVAVGSRGAVLTSPDAYNWTEQNSRVDANLKAVIWGKDRFVAVGEWPGTIITSKDGVSWSKVYSNQYVSMENIMWTGEYYLAAGGQGNIVYSKDGIKWSLIDKGISNDIFGMVTGKDGHIAVGKGRAFLLSQDGKKWDSHEIRNLSHNVIFHQIASNSNTYIAVGQFMGTDFIIRSKNIKHSWGIALHDTKNFRGELKSVVWNGREFVAVGNYGHILASKDGHDWSNLAVNTQQNLNSIIWAEDKYVAVGDGYTVVIKEDEKVVVEVSVTGVKLDRTSLTLNLGETATLQAEVLPQDAANKGVTWTSSNPDVARVDSNGKITAVSSGTAVVTVTTRDGNKKAACDIKVNADQIKELGQPDNLAGVLVESDGAISLTWDSVDDCEYYFVYRSINDDENFFEIAKISVPYYSDEDIQPSTSYYYMVTSASEVTESKSSSIINVAYIDTDDQGVDSTDDAITPDESHKEVITETLIEETKGYTTSDEGKGRSKIFFYLLVPFIIIMAGSLIFILVYRYKKLPKR